MPATLTIRDESTSGHVSEPVTLEFPAETITVRELIRERVYQEVQDYNRERAGRFRGLIQPSDAESDLNGFKLKPGREINWKAQFEKACDAYDHSRILILVGDKQTESLEETITLSRGVEATFLLLTPLVGG